MRCAVCGRRLTNRQSVERGTGPVCRHRAKPTIDCWQEPLFRAGDFPLLSDARLYRLRQEGSAMTREEAERILARMRATTTP